jgi:hypothetical protein
MHVSDELGKRWSVRFLTRSLLDVMIRSHILFVDCHECFAEVLWCRKDISLVYKRSEDVSNGERKAMLYDISSN